MPFASMMYASAHTGGFAGWHDNTDSCGEVVENLGTIARSGTEEFIKELSKSGSDGIPPELIGRFGLGFYSAFMVADQVTVETTKHGEYFKPVVVRYKETD